MLRRSLGGRACKWAERMLVHGEGDKFGQPYRLLPWHREFVWRWYELAPGSDTEWWFIESLVGAERGAVKTELFAALAMLDFAGPVPFRRPTPIVTVAAGSYDQAGELFRQVQIMAGGPKGAEIGTPLSGLFDVFDAEVLHRNGAPGRIERVAAQAGTAEGGKQTSFYADEVHEWKGARERVYTVLSAALTKRMVPGRVCAMSTAAAGRGSMPAKDTDGLLWRLYARGMLERGDPASRFLFDWCEASDRFDLDDPAQLRAALRSMRAADLTWSVEVRAREFETRKMPRHELERYYLNRFVAMAADSWLTELPGAWTECGDRNAAVIPDGADVVVGVDMALHHDSVGVVVAGVLPDGRVGWWPRVWTPDGGRIDHLDVFGTIAGAIAQRWKVKAVTYDPRFFELPANMLEDQGFRVVEFPQSPDRLVRCDGLLFELVRTRQLVHPDDPSLNEHARNAAWRDSDRGRFLSKAKARGHMDLIRAGAMATHELLQGEPDAPSSAPLVLMVKG